MDTRKSPEAVSIEDDHTNATSFNSLITTNSTQPGNSNSGIPKEYVVFYKLANDFYFYGLSVVLPFGLIGNFFSVCVFLLSSILRRTTTGQFLVALAIADSTVLVGDMMRWLAHQDTSRQHYVAVSLGLNFHDTSNTLCKVTHFLRYGGGLWSVWLTIAIAVERMIAVAFPLQISHISTLRKTRVVIFIITFISFSLALFSFWIFEVRDNPPLCKIMDKERYKTWNDVILKFGTLIVPGAVIAIITVIIIVLLYRARKNRLSHLASCTLNPDKQYSKLGISTETQLTIMLVAVCISTTALRGPYTIAYYLRNQCFRPTVCSPLAHMQTFVASRVTEVFSVIHFAINFLLYCLCGSSFRRQIRMTVLCR